MMVVIVDLVCLALGRSVVWFVKQESVFIRLLACVQLGTQTGTGVGQCHLLRPSDLESVKVTLVLGESEAEVPHEILGDIVVVRVDQLDGNLGALVNAIPVEDSVVDSRRGCDAGLPIVLCQ